MPLPVLVQFNLLQRCAAINKQSSSRCECRRYAPQSTVVKRGMPAIQRAHANGKCKVVGYFAFLQTKFLHGSQPYTQCTAGYLRCAGLGGLPDGSSRAVDGEDVATAAYDVRHRPRSRTGAAAYFQYAHAGLQRERINDLRES